MDKRAFSVILASGIFLACVQLTPAQDGADWRTINAQAISAMRAEKYEEAEKLFNEALSKCKLSEDKKSVAGNLALLLHKVERHDDAKNIEQTHCGASGSGSDAMKAEPVRSAAPRPMGQSNARAQSQEPLLKGSVRAAESQALIKSLDEQIKKADAAGELELLQSLFQKKADAIKARDHCQSLEYAYILHYRAQVLVHLKREAEAENLEMQARTIRDAIRNMQANSGRGPAAPEIRPSSLGRMNFGFDHSNEFAETRRENDLQRQYQAEKDELSRMHTRQQENSTSGYMNRYNGKFGK